ncbi:MAG: adenylate/guanylate cyclase domain-containing protein, partial [Leptospiraceae bacterium]|nr:adenylate/guanylate cyclase domain-containing protein [Leptospiraceae bacterium]
MKPFIKIFEAVFGSLKQDSLEHRLFNTLSFFNAITNFGGAFNYLDLPNEWALFSLHLISSLLFIIFYLFSRFRSIYHSLYWPFVLTMLVFLFSNVLINAGSMGGAIFYFIAAIVIASILARSAWQAVLTYVIFMGFIGVLYAIEMYRPEWIRPYANPADRPYDVFGNFMFMLIFTAAIVQVLTRNLHLERRKSDNLLLNIMPASIADELKKHDRVRPVTYDLASVLFTDFVGFTGIAERLNAEELLRELDA